MTAPTTRRSLPLLSLTPVHNGGRDRMTCKYRCGDACFHEIPNTSDNPTFREVVNARVSRRNALKAGGLSAAVLGLASLGTAAPAAAAPKNPGGGLFTAIAPTPRTVDNVTVPGGFTWEPIISWGDPITTEAPEFDFWNQSADAQQVQAGYNADYVTLIRNGNGGNKAVLVFNNEYTNDELMFEVGGSDELTDEQLRIIMAAHGMTVVNVRRQNKHEAWEYVRSGASNRRIHTWTPFTVDGPAAGHEAMRTSQDPTGALVLGTLNNCAGGVTPWGTVLSGEENFNQYFDTTGAPDPDQKLARYGLTSGGRGWERVEDRFHVATEPHEVNRFGWIVEVDPSDPTSTPVKHTALGRFKHEGANVIIADSGHVVAYMGDDERHDYIYKFVSKNKHRKGNGHREHNKALLSEGDLYVAKFVGDGMEDGEWDGTGSWLPLVVDGTSHVPGWTVEEVLIWTRQAADLVGPTKMDRPEDVEPNLTNGRIYAALTNNSQRVDLDEANPRLGNKHGHVIEMSEDGNDHTGLTFHWRIVLLAGDPSDPSAYFLGYDREDVSPISCPDNVAFDPQGNLWISTDGQPGTLGNSDGLYLYPVRGREAGHLQQFLSVPVGAECCGPYIDLDDNTVLAAVQHPGEVSGASPANPVSTYPYSGHGQPRPGVFHAFRPRKPRPPRGGHRG